MEASPDLKFCNPSLLTCLSQEQTNNISKCLPMSYSYCVDAYEEKDRNAFVVALGVNVSTEVDAKKWFQQFQEKTMTTMRVDRTFPESGRKNIFKIRYRCQHNTRSSTTTNKKRSSKNTKCPAFMLLTVKRSDGRKGKNIEHIRNFPTMVRLGFEHNHDIGCADSLRHRDVSNKTEQKFKRLFEAGHSPPSALEAHKQDVQREHGDDYAYVAVDRAVVPDVQWCYRLYYKTFSAKCHGGKGDQLNDEVESAVRENLNCHATGLLELKNGTVQVKRQSDVVQGCTSLSIKPCDPALAASAEETSGNDTMDLNAELSDAFDSLKETILAKMKTEAGVIFRPAAKLFIRSARTLTTDSLLVSALSTFGKSYNAGCLQKKKKCRKNQLAVLKRVRAQPTATAKLRKLNDASVSLLQERSEYSS